MRKEFLNISETGDLEFFGLLFNHLPGGMIQTNQPNINTFVPMKCYLCRAEKSDVGDKSTGPSGRTISSCEMLRR